MTRALTTQSLIITGPTGANLLEYAKTSYLEPSDQQIYLIEHKKDTGTAIGIFIEDIRDLHVNVRTGRRGVRTLVFISDAAKMTPQAQAALLKLLEEPRENLYFLLLTSSPTSLADTILSRCHQEKATIASAKSTNPQIHFMARGLSDEIKKLESDDTYRRRRMALYELAKQFAGADAYTRLKIVASIQAKPREEVLEFIDALTHITGIVLQSKPNRQTIARAKTLLEVGEALRENGNVRTQLLKIVV